MAATLRSLKGPTLATPAQPVARWNGDRRRGRSRPWAATFVARIGADKHILAERGLGGPVFTTNAVGRASPMRTGAQK